MHPWVPCWLGSPVCPSAWHLPDQDLPQGPSLQAIHPKAGVWWFSQQFILITCDIKIPPTNETVLP